MEWYNMNKYMKKHYITRAVLLLVAKSHHMLLLISNITNFAPRDTSVFLPLKFVGKHPFPIMPIE